MFVQRLQDWFADLGTQVGDRVQVGAVLALAGVVLLAAVWLYGSTRPAPVVLRASGGTGASPKRDVSAETTIAVHVAGAVRRPGMVSLKSGARVDEAVRLAGGPIAGADLDAINLAGKVRDGQQILVPRRGQPPNPSTAAAGGPGQASGAPGSGVGPAPGASGESAAVELNSATAAQLDTLPGIGPVLAQRIVDHRSERGRFRSVDELQQVEGIGPKKFAQLRSRVVCRP